MLPLLHLREAGQYLWAAFTMLRQAMELVPRKKWDQPIRRVVACLSRQLSIAGREVAETDTAQSVLLGSEAVLARRNGTSTSGDAGQVSPRAHDEDESEEAAAARLAELEAALDAADAAVTEHEHALFETWMELPEYSGRYPISLLRARAGLEKRRVRPDAGETVDEADKAAQAVTADRGELSEEIIVLARTSPAEAWQLLAGRYAAHPQLPHYVRGSPGWCSEMR